MIGDHRVVALIPARAGSKAVPGKNVRDLAGKPLIAWSIDVAQQTDEIDRVIVSTDGDDIAEAAAAHGAEVMVRPPELATDAAITADVVRDAGKRLRDEGETARYIAVLQPTSPFRAVDDVRRCLERLDGEQLDSIATFIEARLNPFRAFRIEDGRPLTFIAGVTPWLPRQALPPAWELNGAVYAFVMDALDDGPSLLFGKSGAVEMDTLRSLDIDEEADFKVAEALLADGFVAR